MAIMLTLRATKQQTRKKKIKISVRQIAKIGFVYYRLHLEQWIKVAEVSRLDARIMKNQN